MKNLQGDRKGSDQTKWKPKLIWVFAECIDRFVCFVVLQRKLRRHAPWQMYGEVQKYAQALP